MENDLIEVRDEHVRCFQEQGFFRLGRITTDEELRWLRETYDEIFKHKRGYIPHELTTLLGGRTPPSLEAILSPEAIVPTLKNTLFLRNARRAVARLLNVEDAHLRNGWRLFCKPAHADETPWHQDAAYRPPPHYGASVWMPLDPATSESSCLSYIGRSHLGDVQPHQPHDEHLVAENVDSSFAITCPISAGEAIVHHCKTLHYAGPNTTDLPRRALVIVCQVDHSG
jgi:ectoine hydroxylase-related dioxygenase (phytanoyl-CoA dioxygenase family)